jgi:hypothetical protein
LKNDINASLLDFLKTDDYFPLVNLFEKFVGRSVATSTVMYGVVLSENSTHWQNLGTFIKKRGTFK